jgi:hypothetical protein
MIDSSFIREGHKIYSITLSYQRAEQYVQKETVQEPTVARVVGTFFCT